MEKDLHSMLTKNEVGFSKGQRMIVNYILEHYDKAAFMTAGKLAKSVGVSESTVVRFAAELGFDGYPGMRKAMQEMIRSRLTSVQRIEVAKDMIDDSNVIKSVMGEDMGNLQDTLNEVDSEAFNEVVDAIVSAKRVYICGMRTSKFIAGLFGFYLSLLMDNVRIVGEHGSAEAYEEIVRIEKGDVYVGITYPRYSKHAARAMRYAKEHGAKVIGITDSESSPFFGEADVCLYSKCEMMSFIDSLVAPLSMINALIVAIGHRMQDELSDTFKRLEGVWSDYDVYEKHDS